MATAPKLNTCVRSTWSKGLGTGFVVPHAPGANDRCTELLREARSTAGAHHARTVSPRPTNQMRRLKYPVRSTQYSAPGTSYFGRRTLATNERAVSDSIEEHRLSSTVAVSRVSR